MEKIILHILAMPTYSGAENVVCQIMDMFSEDKEIKMIYCSPDGPIRDVLEEKKLAFEPMKKLSVSELRRVIKKVHPSFLHAHDVRASMVAAVCSGRIPLISHMHNNWENLRKISVKSVLYMFPAIKASSIIWVSKSAYEQYYFKQWVKKKSVVLSNIINVEKLRNDIVCSEEDKKYDVVYVGRLTYQKNPQRLIAVIEKVVLKVRDLKVGIIGDGDLTEDVNALIKEKKLDKNIELLGYINKPLSIVNNAKVFLMTSRWEGTPMCVLEALAIGIPVVSTPVDGMVELIENGENGYMSDDDERLAHIIIDIMSDDELRKKMSDAAKVKSENYNSITLYKKKLDKIYG